MIARLNVYLGFNADWKKNGPNCQMVQSLLNAYITLHTFADSFFINFYIEYIYFGRLRK